VHDNARPARRLSKHAVAQHPTVLTQTDAAKHKATEVYAAAKTRVIAKLPAAFVPSIVQPAFTTGPKAQPKASRKPLTASLPLPESRFPSPQTTNSPRPDWAAAPPPKPAPCHRER